NPGRRNLGRGRRSILLWDAATGQELRAYGHGESVEFLVFSPDGKLLASATSGRPVRFWEVATGRERFELTGLERGAYALAFSPDGKRVGAAAAERDRVVYVWEVLTGQEVCRFVGHNAVSVCLAFAPDGRTVASGSVDSTILLWDLTGSQKAT